MLRLKFLRISRGLRQHQVAAILGICRPHASMLENGVLNPTARQRDLLAKMFQIPAEKLFEPVAEGDL